SPDDFPAPGYQHRPLVYAQGQKLHSVFGRLRAYLPQGGRPLHRFEKFLRSLRRHGVVADHAAARLCARRWQDADGAAAARTQTYVDARRCQTLRLCGQAPAAPTAEHVQPGRCEVIAVSHTVTLQPFGVEFECGEEETILAAALRSGISLRYGCKHGGCGSCKVQLREGEVDYEGEHATAISESEQDAGLA